MNSADNRLNKKQYNILDLAAGDISFLRRLLNFHEGSKCSDTNCTKFGREFAENVKYVAIDYKFSPEIIKAHKKFVSKYPKCIKYIPHKFNLVWEADLLSLKEKYKNAKFDLIILNNALHEISLNKWPTILLTVYDLLKVDGHFALIDLTNPMALVDIEQSYTRFKKKCSFWDADAIYCINSAAGKLISHIGLKSDCIH